MFLSESQTSSVVDHLKKCGVTACPVCERKEWNVSDRVFALPEYLPSSFSSVPPRGQEPYRLTEDSQVFPLVLVVCSTCGHVLLLSAIALKIVSLTKQGI